MLSKMSVKARPSVLWCYKKDLYLSSHRKKRAKQIKKLAARGLLDAEGEDPFALFVASTNIRYCYYAETHKVLGNTYGMLVLQDFEALTPNLLARTIETVEGGGIVVLLLSNMASLRQLYSLTMDAHARLRTGAGGELVPRFNERLALSLASCGACLICDDELNVLASSRGARELAPVDPDAPAPGGEARAELRELAASLADAQPAGALVARCATRDQAKAVVTLLDAAAERTLRGTVALTAGRGRGKSAALGLALAGAVALGYSNVFVTSPSPENLKTLFEFLFKGLDDLGYKESLDYEAVESANPAFGRAIVRVNVFRDHRQTVQYVQPHHPQALAQAELLVIDEAAAIPLPVVRALLGPYLVFLCSTVSGYEGTGRSLSLKLIEQLRRRGAKVGAGPDAGTNEGARSLREVKLEDPIRYAPRDPVEAWLNGLLCLDAADRLPPPPARLPHPDECQLYEVQRDTLFSYHAASEAFLQRCMALYVASHYKNTPNDLLLLADAPAHRLFVLLGPRDPAAPPGALPDVLAVVQVALEGAVAAKVARAALASGQLPAGDLIPWTVGQQFQDPDFARLSGARVVRIAVHPGLTRAGYGSKALDELRRFYEGQLLDADLVDAEEGGGGGNDAGSAKQSDRARPPASSASSPPADASASLATETIAPRRNLPPLLTALSDVRPDRLHYLGVACGLTPELLGFWSRGGFRPLYLRQTANDVTGEHTIVMLRALAGEAAADVRAGPEWLAPFVDDFRRRFLDLLGGAFRDMPPALALSILEPKLTFSEAQTKLAEDGEAQNGTKDATGDAALSAASSAAAPSSIPLSVPTPVFRHSGEPITPHDLARLGAYAKGLVDHHMIADLLPPLASAFFAASLPLGVSPAQAALLLVLGLQNRTVDDAAAALGLPSGHALALLSKLARKAHAHLDRRRANRLGAALPRSRAARMPAAADADRARAMDDELEDAARDAAREARKRRAADAARAAGLGDAEALASRYAIPEDVAGALSAVDDRELGAGALVSVPTDGEAKKRKGDDAEETAERDGRGGKGKETPAKGTSQKRNGKTPSRGKEAADGAGGFGNILHAPVSDKATKKKAKKN